MKNRFHKNTIFALSLLSLFFLGSCRVPLSALYNEIRKYKYIPYTTPLEYSGVGTILGGSPSNLSMLVPPERCFPDYRPNPEGVDFPPIPTDLRYVDETTLPKRTQSINIDIKTMAKLFNLLKNGNPTIEMGADFSYVKSIIMEMKGAKVVYMDSVKLAEYYQNHMSESCKLILDRVPVIIQALRVDELNFTFYKQNGSRVYFDLQNIDNFLDIKADIKFNIINNTVLNIVTPKYIGFQVAALRRKDDGLALYRATRTYKGKFYFQNLSIFPVDNKTIKSIKAPEEVMQEEYYQEVMQAQEILDNLTQEDLLENTSIFSVN